jgi:hypothetical protein
MAISFSLNNVYNMVFKTNYEEKMSRKAQFLLKKKIRDKRVKLDRQLKVLWSE